MRTRLDDDTRLGAQVGFEGLGTPLAHTRFLVVDVETTGLGAEAGITEIGAILIGGAAPTEEFHSMVRPDHPIPPRITALTGITQSMVDGADPIESVYPHFAAWAGLEDEEAPPVLVAHNASFDLGFLRRAASACGVKWRRGPVVDTLALARLVLPRPLVRNHKLATLASHFGVAQPETHRALGDSRTTWEVLQGLIGLAEPLGVTTLDDLSRIAEPIPRKRRARSNLAAGLPRTPGVYRFEDGAGTPLYIGSSVDLSARVRSYYTAAEKRRTIQRMVDLAEKIRVDQTGTLLEARVRELRDIHALRPLFNSASTHQAGQHWLVRSGEGLDCVPLVSAQEALGALGPFGTRAHAIAARDAIARALAPDPSDPLTAAGIIESGRDEDARAALEGRSRIVAERLCTLMSDAAEAQRYEDAARLRHELASYLTGVDRRWSILPLALASRIVWAIHRDEGGWELHASAWGRHLSSVVTAPKTLPTPWVDALVAAEAPRRPDVLLAHATWAETRVLAQSLNSATARLVHWEGELPRAHPVASPLGLTDLRSLIEAAEEETPRFVR